MPGGGGGGGGLGFGGWGGGGGFGRFLGLAPAWAEQADDEEEDEEFEYEEVTDEEAEGEEREPAEVRPLRLLHEVALRLVTTAPFTASLPAHTSSSAAAHRCWTISVRQQVEAEQIR